MVKKEDGEKTDKRTFAWQLTDWCRKNRLSIKEQRFQKLTEKLRGHYGYYGIIGNFFSLLEVREEARGIWRRLLSQRLKPKPTHDVVWIQPILEERYSLPRV